MAPQQHRDSKRHIAHNRCKKQTNPALSLWKLPVVVSLVLDDFASVALPSSSTTSLGPSINDVDNWEGGGFKNWSKLPTDSTKKTADMGEGVSKIRKNCRRRLWMVPFPVMTRSSTFPLFSSPLPSPHCVLKWVFSGHIQGHYMQQQK